MPVDGFVDGLVDASNTIDSATAIAKVGISFVHRHYWFHIVNAADMGFKHRH